MKFRDAVAEQGKGRGSFYTREKIGPKQSLTPEGFLLCEEVPIARTGMMIYGPEELPIEPGQDQLVRVFRGEEDLFNQETIASANGKSVVNDHPADDVVPANWRDVTIGFAVNIRRGGPGMDDLLLADLLITTPEGIELVRGGKVEVSMGYDADYEQTEPGFGRQTNLIFNHIALVDEGRCGPRCAIRDRKTLTKEKGNMSLKKKRLLDSLARALKLKGVTLDSAEMERVAEEATKDDNIDDPTKTGDEGGEGGDTHIHIHAGGEGSGDESGGQSGTGRAEFTDDDVQAKLDELMSRVEALERALAGGGSGEGGDINDEAMSEEELQQAVGDEVPEELKEEAVKAKDSAYLGNSFRDTVAMAEILAPGIQVPTFDRSAKARDSMKAICGLRRKALDAAYADSQTRPIISGLLGGKVLDTKRMTCDAARVLFRAAANSKAMLNNIATTRTTDAAPANNSTGITTIAELNKANAEYWAKRS